METQAATKTTTSKLVERKFRLSLNKHEGEFHILPPKERKYEKILGCSFLAMGGVPTRAVTKGLDTVQERYFAPQLITKSPQDDGYAEDMHRFWLDFTVKVDDNPLDLDASYTEEEVMLDGKLTSIKLPTNLNHYIIAEVALSNTSLVAFTKEQKLNKSMFDFILDDLSVVQKKEEDLFKLVNQAMEAYIELVKKSTNDKVDNKVDFLLDAMKEENPEQAVVLYGLSPTDKLKALKRFSEKQPDIFLNKVNSPNLEYESLLYNLTQSLVLDKEGELYFNGDLNLGNKKQALEYLKDQTKTAEVTKLKQRLNEKLKKGL